jgi:hypothetical protein
MEANHQTTGPRMDVVTDPSFFLSFLSGDWLHPLQLVYKRVPALILTTVTNIKTKTKKPCHYSDNKSLEDWRRDNWWNVLCFRWRTLSNTITVQRVKHCQELYEEFLKWYLNKFILCFHSLNIHGVRRPEYIYIYIILHMMFHHTLTIWNCTCTWIFMPKFRVPY